MIWGYPEVQSTDEYTVQPSNMTGNSTILDKGTLESTP